MRIVANAPLAVDLDVERWRLNANGSTPPALLVEARAGDVLRYSADFAAPQRLPLPAANTWGEIAPDQIGRVVVGWSESDGAWHLGLLLQGAMAEQRRSRWVELAAWSDPTAVARRGDAEQAGETLAAHLGKPFALIPPKVAAPSVAAPAPAYASPSPTPPAASLTQEGAYERAYLSSTLAQPASPGYAMPYSAPLPSEAAAYGSAYGSAYGRAATPAPLPDVVSLDGWLLERDQPNAGSAIWHRRGGWKSARVLRAVWYLFWGIVAALLAYRTFTAGIKLVEMQPVVISLPQREITLIPELPPQLLPALGFVCAFLLIVAAAYTFVTAFSRVSRVEFDRATGQIRGVRGGSQAWALDRTAVQALYVAETVGKANTRKGTRALYEVEYFALRNDDQFQSLLHVPGLDEKIATGDDVANDSGTRPLNEGSAQSPAQQAAVVMARALDLPARYDRRVR